ncbi:uncharacterized protein [Salminus brasiliensis]|uniref:uncharacterized protein n=1 Tax=Salminus brasiliensis TaxID=930266 RepID=UPI003B837575
MTGRFWIVSLCWIGLCFQAVLSGHAVYSVLEEVRPGTLVGNLAKDLSLNVGDLEARKLRIVSGSSKKHFEVDLKSGALFVLDVLDREQLCPNSLACTETLEAIVNDPLQMYSVEVKILDINDHSPVFPEKSQTIRVAELALVGSKFPLLGADDPDIGMNSISSYKLSQNAYFNLEVHTDADQGPSAELVLLKSLDREKQATVRLVLTAVDGGRPPRSGMTEINVVVLDANDNAPVFSKSVYKVLVPENIAIGTIFVKLNATDLDEGINSELLYSFKQGQKGISDKFSIDSSTGELSVIGELDYESTSAYEIRVEARDGGSTPLVSHCKVLVEVVDVNDNAPDIKLSSLLDSVREDARKGTVIALITVQDKDGGKNGKVHCSMSKNSPFVLESTQGKYYSLVLSGALDREENDIYNVSITATDEGTPALSSITVVTVRVSDVNDNPPRFPEPSINVYVKENSPAGGLIAVVSAKDIDMGENAHVTYSLCDSSNTPLSSVVSINSVTGEIYSMQSFNYEEMKHLQFQVQATDSGTPPLSSNVTVNVFILDENDNSPVILPPYSEAGSVNTENIPYSAEAGYFVAKIRAVDADSGYNALLSYHITEPKGTNLFRIGSSSGEIRTKRRMSDNDLKTHPLVLTVCDHGDPSLSATVSVDVVVVESLDSMQPSLRQVPMKEEGFSDLNLYLLIAIVSVSVIFLLSLIALIVAKCYSSDGAFSSCSAPVVTTHPDGSWSYSKSTQQYDVCFSSDTLKSDVVVFPSPFPPVDAELISINGGDTFTRTQTLPSSEKAVLSGHAVYSVLEEVRPGTLVGNLAKDLSLNVGDLEARKLRIVSGSSKKHFEVDLKSGALFVLDVLDREQLCPNSLACTETLEAIVNDPLQMYSVEVKILDINDHSPVFPGKSQTIRVAESALVGSKFPLLGADDPDIGMNSISSYKLSQNAYFNLEVHTDADQGPSAELVLLKSLDREKQATVRLVLTAVDGGRPPRSGMTEINVVVLDANDNAPVFSKSVYKVLVPEDIAIGTIFVKLNATDLDEGINSELLYSFKQGQKGISDKFSIDSSTGEMSVIGELDYESTSAYEIRVEARDGGATPLVSHCKVLVEVVDVNDNAPDIKLSSLLDSVREDARKGTVIALITVQDKDGGKNGKVHCSMSKNSPFVLESTQGKYYSLVLSGALDREENDIYNVSITATDEGTPALSSISVVTVRVSDVNDNPPRFPEPSINVYVKENSPAGGLIAVVSAKDSDMGENAHVTYSLFDSSNTPLSSVVSINSVTGEIYSMQSFNYEEMKHLQFQVQATDSGTPPLSSNVTVNVFILDENDNSPVILPPYSEAGSVNTENIPYSAEAGYFVAKIRAVDADSGYNALLSYHITEPKGTNLFRIGSSSGEIRTKRRMSDNDLKTHPLVLTVCDHGEPSLSATVSVDVVVVESLDSMQPSLRQVPMKEEGFSDLNLYLLIAIVSVSVIFLLSLIALIAAKCYGSDGAFSSCSAPVITTHPDGSWSYSKSTQQYDVCFSSDTLKSDVVVFPSPFPPVDAELISINGGDTFTRTQTLPSSEKVRAFF